VRSVLYWPDTCHQRRTLFIRHGRHDNVSTFRLADGYKNFESFCTEVGESFGSDDEPLVQPSEVVSKEKDEFDDGEYSDLPPTDQLSPDENPRVWIIGPSTGSAVKHSTDPNTEPTRIELTTTEFDLNGPSGPQDIIEEEEDKIPDNHVAELLRLHYKFDHADTEATANGEARGATKETCEMCSTNMFRMHICKSPKEGHDYGSRTIPGYCRR
jgi:hypothetical protein